MIKELEEYLERRGAKYFITMLMFSYVLGTLVFTIYLGALGISDFEFLQLRYMFVGILYTIITAILLLPVFWGLKKIFSKLKGRVLEVTFGLVLVVWTPIYALNIFPKIPSNFGGARPVLARFIGNTDKIREINEIIEYETGAKDLPLEIFARNGNLAKGANVKILDRNKDRIWIILTKDLYLSSRSKLAKDLIEAGESLDHETAFVTKPLLVDAEGIKNISFSLYEPPDDLTEADLEILKSTPILSVKSTEVVTKFIEKVTPEKAAEIIKVIKSEDRGAIDMVIEENFNMDFINFRNTFFQKLTYLTDIERSHGIEEGERWNFTFTFMSALQETFPSTNISLEKIPYLSDGIKEKNYIKKMAKALQGASDIEVIISRMQALELDPIDIESDPLETGSGSSID